MEQSATDAKGCNIHAKVETLGIIGNHWEIGKNLLDLMKGKLISFPPSPEDDHPDGASSEQCGSVHLLGGTT